MPHDYPYPPAAPKPNLPRPALGNPSLERAHDALKKLYPRDMAGVEIQPDWGPLSETNIGGFVKDDQPNTIHINALRGALGHQETVDRTAAHELEHVRQNRQSPEQQQVYGYQRRLMPYEERPYEQAAHAASETFSNARTPTTHDTILPNIWSDVVQQNQRSPAVEELLKLLNKR